MDKNKEILDTLLSKMLFVINKYKWLIDLYVLDFFVDNHWDALPPSWQKSLADVDPIEIGKLLLGKKTTHMFPLSLLCLVQTVNSLSLPREPTSHTHQNKEHDTTLYNLLFKHVKLKKRHEICVMAEVISKISRDTGCRVAVDCGSGVGHLVRLLSYQYGLHTVGIEAQPHLTQEARKLDLELEKSLTKHQKIAYDKSPTHLTMTLSSAVLPPLPEPETQYGLVGLHPCGDLGPALLRQFVADGRARSVCVVGCCYPRLSAAGYPLSAALRGRALRGRARLSRAARDIACHALELYADRLLAGDYHYLKVHAYRAALERLLVVRGAVQRHAQVANVKLTHPITFSTYYARALRMGAVADGAGADADWAQAERDVRAWRRVVALYSVRLVLAPLLESLLLLDRVLYLRERGMRCEVRAAFDPKISPRNLMIIGTRPGP